MIINDDSLSLFFLKLQVDADLIETYIASLSKVGVNNKGDLRGFASIWNLKKLSIREHDVQNIMQTLFADVKAAESRTSNSSGERFLIDEEAMQCAPSYLKKRHAALSDSSRLTKNTIEVNFQEIGRGASGRVSKALFAPTLTLVAIKRIEIKDAITRKVVGQELKFLYEVARSDLISTLPTESDNNTIESPKLSLLSGELYSDVIAGNHSLQSPSCTTNLEGSPNVLETVRTAKSPYIISFYDAYIDPEYGAVCLVLEYMNAGSIQNMLTEGRKFNEDDAAVVAFSVLHALIELHSRNILHRDIKPSNILADRAGHIKLTDFGLTKGIFTLLCAHYDLIHIFHQPNSPLPSSSHRNARGKYVC